MNKFGPGARPKFYYVDLPLNTSNKSAILNFHDSLIVRMTCINLGNLVEKLPDLYSPSAASATSVGNNVFYLGHGIKFNCAITFYIIALA